MKAILALDMGGTNIKGGVFAADGRPLGETAQTPVNSSGEREEVLSTIGSFVRMLTEGTAVEAVSVSTPGPFRYRDGVSDMTRKYPALNGVPLREEIRRRGGLKEDTPVEFLSDANAYLIGERFYGAGRGCDHLGAVTLGTGLGYSVMEDGAVLVNENGRPYDLPCFDPFRDGVLENLVSGTGVAKEYERRTGRATTAKEMAERRDEVSLEVFREMGRELGRAMRPRAERHHMKRFVVGGQMALAMELFADELRAELPGVEVVRAENIADAALFGAAAHTLGMDAPWRLETM